ncbi:hypothetical protein [Halomonas organivorans]|uniref:Uncharacterized protein n=1 Tax=Halomonas organivorans TaxID=257772 RepID=A0A7W5BVQ6_9GAMM|nr:hypothetical protein [Halomonas organivorans]MBB3140032.1 hypothetical protein [Halomonas organivorans]
MTAGRARLYYTCTFLCVSFRALRESVDGHARRPGLPCWLDTRTVEMLSAELRRCREEAVPFAELHRPLDHALYHCGLLMAQCPGALDHRRCRQHLGAIIAPLEDTTTLLASPPRREGPWLAAARRLGGWLRH